MGAAAGRAAFQKNKTVRAFRISSEMVFDDIEHAVTLGSRTPDGTEAVSLRPCSDSHGFETVVREKAVESGKVSGWVHLR
jgi:hypothetical protein